MNKNESGAGSDSPAVFWLPAGRLQAEKGAEKIPKYTPGPGVTRPAGDAQAVGVTARCWLLPAARLSQRAAPMGGHQPRPCWVPLAASTVGCMVSENKKNEDERGKPVMEQHQWLQPGAPTKLPFGVSPHRSPPALSPCLGCRGATGRNRDVGARRHSAAPAPAPRWHLTSKVTLQPPVFNV